MKSLIQNLLGGIVIIVVSTAVGILHNSVRSHPMRLLPRLQPEVTISPAETAHSHNESTEVEIYPGGQTNSSTPSGDLEPGAVSIKQVKTLLEHPSTYIIDARSEKAFNDGHIPGAINVPYDRFVEFYDFLSRNVPMDAPIICYCWSTTCDFSDHLAEELRIMGYENVTIFRGGIEAWEEAGYPVEQ